MRKAFSDTLTTLADEDPSVFLVTGDLGFEIFDEFRARFPERFINVGVAEAQMIYVAAGLALEGFKPVTYSIASFATARPFEQIRFCVDYPNLKVLMIGAGRGLTYASSGVSHHAIDDLSLMTTLPNMTVVCPGDADEVASLLPQALEQSGPKYFSVGRYGEPTYEALEDPILGKARKIREGRCNAAIICTGEIIYEALLAWKCLRRLHIEPALYQMHTVKPIDVDLLSHLVDEEVNLVVVVEEHFQKGGLGSAIWQWFVGNSYIPALKILGIRDCYALGNFERDEMRRKFGLDAKAIAKACSEVNVGGEIWDM